LKACGEVFTQENRRAARLQTGACVREGCSATRYRITLQKHPDLDWAQLLSAESSPATEGEEQPVDAQEEAVETGWGSLLFSRRPLAVRVTILVVLLLLVLVWRQVYFGGRIPLLREPEKFWVDPVRKAKARRRTHTGRACNSLS